MFIEEPKVEYVEIDMSEAMFTSANSKCIQDGATTQGGGSCIGNQDHSSGEGCAETAPLVAG